MENKILRIIETYPDIYTSEIMCMLPEFESWDVLKCLDYLKKNGVIL